MFPLIWKTTHRFQHKITLKYTVTDFPCCSHTCHMQFGLNRTLACTVISANSRCVAGKGLVQFMCFHFMQSVSGMQLVHK